MDRLFLGYESAFWIWRKVGPLGHLALKPTRVRSLAGGAPSKSKVNEFRHAHPDLVRKPLDLLVAYGDQRIMPDVKCHVRSNPLPDRSFYRLDESVFIASPELCLMQLATKLTVPEVTKLGIEMCGSYAIDNLTSSSVELDEPGFASRPPLTSAKNLQLYCDRLLKPGSRGRAAQFVRWVVNDSASPRETALYMLLCMPPRLGGYGIPQPELNVRIDFSPKDRLLTKSEYFKCDLYWGNRSTAVEYDSAKHHTLAEKQERDAIRRNMLQYKDVQVIVATRQQLNDASRFDKLARQIASPVGKRLRIPEREHVRHRAQLRHTVFDWDLFEML